MPTRSLSDHLPERQRRLIAKALADPRRFAILRAIAAEDEVACRTICATFPIAQATVSHHIKELVTAGLIDERQEGQAKFLRARRAVLRAYLDELRREFELGQERGAGEP